MRTGRGRAEDQRLDAEAVGDVEDLLDEKVRAADDGAERDKQLEHDGRHARRIASCRVEDEWAEALLSTNQAAVQKRPAHVADEGEHEHDRARDLNRIRRAEPEHESNREAAHEEGEIALEGREGSPATSRRRPWGRWCR